MTYVCVCMLLFFFLARTWSLHRFLTAALWSCLKVVYFHSTRHSQKCFEFLSNKDWKTKTDEMLIREYTMLGTVVQFLKTLSSFGPKVSTLVWIRFYLKNLKCLFFFVVGRQRWFFTSQAFQKLCSVLGSKPQNIPIKCPSLSVSFILLLQTHPVVLCVVLFFSSAVKKKCVGDEINANIQTFFFLTAWDNVFWKVNISPEYSHTCKGAVPSPKTLEINNLY